MKINILNLTAFSRNKILYYDRRENPSCIIEKGVLKPVENGRNIKKCMIGESLLDLKIIKIPVVSRNLLKSIVMNEIKKHSAINPTDGNIDYLVLKKEDNQYDILVFIKLFNDSLESNNRFYSAFNVMAGLMKDKNFPDDSQFIINDGKAWFLYTFKDRILRKRDVYYREDLKSLKKGGIYFIDLFNTGMRERGFLSVKSELLQNALLSLNNDIFKINKKLPLKLLIAVILGSFIILASVFLEVRYYFFKLKEKDMSTEIKKLEILYRNEKSKRGISDEEYGEYLKLIDKKSRVNNFFYALYNTGGSNIEIKNITYTDKNFEISGSCRDDSKLEDAFRKSFSWKNVAFSFSRRNNKLFFSIEGKFSDE